MTGPILISHYSICVIRRTKSVPFLRKRLCSRRNRCTIPVSSELLKPQIVRDVKKIIIYNKSRAKLQPGEQIFVKLSDRHKNGYLNKAKSRSYDVSINGGTYRQNYWYSFLQASLNLEIETTRKSFYIIIHLKKVLIYTY
jgi:hypothetical protein